MYTQPSFSGNIMRGNVFPRGCLGGYTFGFNGQQKDDEVSGDGNSYTAEFWQYDPRTGRRWNIDPVKETGVSVYACFANNPIYYSDPNGNFRTKAGAWLYRLLWGQRGDHIYQAPGEDNKGEWIVGRTVVEIYHYTNAAGIPFKIANYTELEFTEWGSKPRGGIWVHDSNGSGTDADPKTHGHPSHQVDLADLGIFGKVMGRKKAMSTFKWYMNKIGGQDAKDVTLAVQTIDKALKNGDRAVDIVKGVKSIIEGLIGDDKPTVNNIPTTTFPDSLDKVELKGGWATLKKGSNDTVQRYLVDPDSKPSNSDKTFLKSQNERK